MQEVIAKLEKTNRKGKIPAIKSGDIVRVHQKIREGGKERVQMFEGVVIRTRKMNSLQANITVRRIASGVGVEKTFLMHSPTVEKITIERRSKVRRNYLNYLRLRSGKSARMRERAFEELTIGSDEDIDAQVVESVQAHAEETKNTEKSSEVEKAEQDHSQEAERAENTTKQTKEKTEAKTDVKADSKDKADSPATGKDSPDSKNPKATDKS